MQLPISQLMRTFFYPPGNARFHLVQHMTLSHASFVCEFVWRASGFLQHVHIHIHVLVRCPCCYPCGSAARVVVSGCSQRLFNVSLWAPSCNRGICLCSWPAPVAAKLISMGHRAPAACPKGRVVGSGVGFSSYYFWPLIGDINPKLVAALSGWDLGPSLSIYS